MTQVDPITVKQIAEIVGGEVRGDPLQTIDGIQPLVTAGPKDLSFFASGSRRNRNDIVDAAKATRAGAILVTEFVDFIPATQIQVANPLAAISTLSARFSRNPSPEPTIDARAVVAASARIEEGVYVGPYAVIGEHVSIGKGCKIYPHVVIYDHAYIGPGCVIHAGAVIREHAHLAGDCLIQPGAVVGGDGFGYLPDPQLGYRRIPHIGRVFLEEGVDIGANTTVDRGTFGETRIGKASKLDNLVMVGHNCNLGERVICCGQVGISGSTEIGSDVTLAGKVGIADHVKVGNKVRAAALTGIISDVHDGQEIGGYPHMDFRDWLRLSLAIKKIPELFRRVKTLEQKRK